MHEEIVRPLQIDFYIGLPPEIPDERLAKLRAFSPTRAIRALPSEIGLNVFLRSHPRQTLEVPVESPTILWDLDTPEDYRRILAVWEECKE